MLGRKTLGVALVLSLAVGACTELTSPVANRSENVEALPLSQEAGQTLDELLVGMSDRSGGGFAGFHVNEAGVPIVLVKQGRDSERARSEVARVYGAQVELLGSQIRYVSYSFRELYDWYQVLLSHVSARELLWFDIDEVANRIVLSYATDGARSAAERFAADRGIPTDSYRMEIGEPFTMHQTLDDWTRPVLGGVEINTFTSANAFYRGCSAGPNVRIPGYTLDEFLITAAHCMPVYSPSTAYIYQDTVPQLLGYLVGNATPTWSIPNCNNSNCKHADVALIRYYHSTSSDYGYFAQTAFSHPSMGSVDLVGRFRISWIGSRIPAPLPYSGLSINKVGKITGWTTGTVQSTCIGATGSNGVQFPCSYTANYGSAGGDSGAPVFNFISGNTAYIQGIHIGSAGSTAVWNFWEEITKEIKRTHPFALYYLPAN